MKRFFKLVNMYINSCIIIVPELILYVGFENAACRFDGTRWKYRDADKSLARPGRKQATATEDFDVRLSYL